jgi:hypothetical protein
MNMNKTSTLSHAIKLRRKCVLGLEIESMLGTLGRN